MQRAVPRAEAVALAVETAIGHLLRQDVIRDRLQQLRRRAEVAGIVQSHAADAHVALGAGFRRIDAAIRPLVVSQNIDNALQNLRVVGRDAEMAQVQQRVVRRRPFRLVEASAPVAGRLARGQELLTPAFGGDARLQVGPFLVEQVTVNLVLERNVAVQEPGDQGIEGSCWGHGSLHISPDFATDFAN